MRISRPSRRSGARGISAAVRRGSAPARGISDGNATRLSASASRPSGISRRATRPTGSREQAQRDRDAWQSYWDRLQQDADQRERDRQAAEYYQAQQERDRQAAQDYQAQQERHGRHRRPGTTGRQSDSGIGTNERRLRRIATTGRPHGLYPEHRGQEPRSGRVMGIVGGGRVRRRGGPTTAARGAKSLRGSAAGAPAIPPNDRESLRGPARSKAHEAIGPRPPQIIENPFVRPPK